MKLPCPHGRQARTTVGIEACAAMQERRLEHRINPLVVAIFGRMAGVDARTPRGGPFDFSFRGSARVRFIRAERSWVAYRAATCSSRADAMAGGSGSLDLLATCFVALDRRHLADLAAFAAQLGPS
jgi:uncharacterized protein YecT (DUF1311 family)